MSERVEKLELAASAIRAEVNIALDAYEAAVRKAGRECGYAAGWRDGVQRAYHDFTNSAEEIRETVRALSRQPSAPPAGSEA